MKAVSSLAILAVIVCALSDVKAAKHDKSALTRRSVRHDNQRKEVIKARAKEMCSTFDGDTDYIPRDEASCACLYSDVSFEHSMLGHQSGGDFGVHLRGPGIHSTKKYHCHYLWPPAGGMEIRGQADEVYLAFHANANSTCAVVKREGRDPEKPIVSIYCLPKASTP